MEKTLNKFLAITLMSSALLSGCDSVPFIDDKPDYKSAGKAKTLEVPPDLTSISSNDNYSIPGSTSYSTYSQIQGDEPGQKEKLLPNPDNIRIERAGSQRWLVVQARPEKIWPVIRDFWTELGFAVRVENSETGVMETEWVDASSLKDDKGNYLDKFQGWLDKLSALNNRQKFRTRIDRGDDPTATEIFISHRAVTEVQDDGKNKIKTRLGVYDTGYSDTKRTRRDEEQSEAEDLDAELMRRLMVRLGVEEKKSKSILATNTSALRAYINKEKDGSVNLSINDDFDRAWRRVGLALDRVGFVVEDRNRADGIYYVRYADLDVITGNKEKGILDSLKFWGDDAEKEKKPAPEETKSAPTTVGEKLQFWKAPPQEKIDNTKQYRVKVEQVGEKGSRVVVVNKAGEEQRSNTADQILSLLYEQLK
jgi:outer membrane protein assembly factor BamC